MNEPEQKIQLPDFDATNRAMIFQMIRDEQLYFEWLKLQNRAKNKRK